MAQTTYYTYPGAPDFETGVFECATPAQACELGDALELVRDDLSVDGDNSVTLVVGAGEYREDRDFDQVVLNSNDPDDNDVLVLVGWNRATDPDALSLPANVVATLDGEYDFTVGNIEQAAGGVNNFEIDIVLDELELVLEGEPTVSFADDSQILIEGTADVVGETMDQALFSIDTNSDVDIQIAEPDPSEPDADEADGFDDTPNAFIEYLVLDGNGEKTLDVIERFGAVNDPILAIGAYTEAGGEDDRFDALTDDITTTGRLEVLDGEFRSGDGVLALYFNAEAQSLDVDGDFERETYRPIFIDEDAEVFFDDIFVGVESPGFDDNITFGGEGVLASNGLFIYTEADRNIFNFTEVSGPLTLFGIDGVDDPIIDADDDAVGDDGEANEDADGDGTAIDDEEADVIFNNLTMLGVEDQENLISAIAGGPLTVVFRNAVEVMGDTELTDVVLYLDADFLPNGTYGASTFTEELTFSGSNADVWLGYDPNGSSPDSYHNLRIQGGDIFVEAETEIFSEARGNFPGDGQVIDPLLEDLIRDGDIVGNALFFVGDDDTQLYLEQDLIVSYLIIDKEDQGDEVELEERDDDDDLQDGELVIDDFEDLDLFRDGDPANDPLMDPSGLLVILEGELTTNGRLDAGGDEGDDEGAIIVLDENGELDRDAGDLAYSSDDPEDLPDRLIYTGTDITRQTGDEIEQIEELEAIGISIEDGTLVLDQDITLTDELILGDGTLDLVEEGALLTLEIDDTDEVADVFEIIVNDGLIEGTDADNLEYPSETTDNFEVGLDGLQLFFVGDDDHMVGAEFPANRPDEVVYLQKSEGSDALLTLMEDEAYRVNGDVIIEDGSIDINGSTFEQRSYDMDDEFAPDVEVFQLEADASLVDSNLGDTTGADTGLLLFTGEDDIVVLVDGGSELFGGDRAYDFPRTEINMDAGDPTEDTDNDIIFQPLNVVDGDGDGFPGNDSGLQDIVFVSLTVTDATDDSDEVADDDYGVLFSDLLENVGVLESYTQVAGDVIFDNVNDVEVGMDVMVESGTLLYSLGTDDDETEREDDIEIGGMYMQTGGYVLVAGNSDAKLIDGDFMQTGGDYEFFGTSLYVFNDEGVGEGEEEDANFYIGEDADFFLYDGRDFALEGEECDLDVPGDDEGGFDCPFITRLVVYGDFTFMGGADTPSNDEELLEEDFDNAFEGEVFFSGDVRQLVQTSIDVGELLGVDLDEMIRKDPRFDAVTIFGEGGIQLLSDFVIDDDGSLTLRDGLIDTQDNTYSTAILNTETEVLFSRDREEIDGQRNNPADLFGNTVRLGTRDSFVDGTVTREIQGETATGGIVNAGYFFPVGLETAENEFFAPLLLQFATRGRTSTAQVTTFGADTADPDVQNARAAFQPFAVQEDAEDTDADGLVLNTLGSVFYKVEFDRIPAEDPNIRVVADFLPRGAINEIRALRIVQLPCVDGDFEPRLAGLYDVVAGAPDVGGNALLNDFVNGVPNIVQEGVEVEQCQIFAVATDNFRNDIGEEVGPVASVQLIHASPDAPAVDIYVNEGPAATLDYLEATAFTFLPIDAQVDVYPMGADVSATDPVLSLTLDLMEEGAYVVAVTGTADASDDVELGVVVKEEARLVAEDEGEVELFAIHAVPGGPVVDLQLFGLGVTAYDDLEFNEVSDYADLAPDTYTFDVRTNDGTQVVAERFDLTAYEGEALAFVVAPADGSDAVVIAGYDVDGNRIGSVVVTDVEGPGELPTEFALQGNYPNPFNPSTTIQFDLPQAAQVTVEVVDMLGRRVMMLPAQAMAAGSNQQVRLNANSLASGNYIYRVVAQMGDEMKVATGRMVLLK